MKKILVALVASTALVAPAFAQDANDSTSFQVTASVPPECAIEAMGTLAFGNISIADSPGPNALIVLNSSNNPDQTVWASCNTQARITLSSANQGLVSPSNAGNSDPDFTNQVFYRLHLQSTDGTAPNVLLITQSDASESEDSVGAFHDQVKVTASIRNGDNPDSTRPLAGNDYADTATITLTAL